jgi:two-component system chemotaxis response regulator CheY
MSQKRVLIVDDDETISDLLMVLTEHLLPDYQVVAVKDGATALAELRAQSFNLILTDYNMPQMNGLDLARAARQISPGIPIILMTGDYICREIQAGAGSAPLVGLLAKPFTMLQLKEILQRSGV